ncbi:hypothetical protein M409DRAFT_65021 [Zasmidium cellare ATCC 36951]|uniref:DUF7357 domain-containing protein n=1 Tax=Zasmidium cellare ATCC 36951 TaxID=1080233 RepID=A0A6A6CPV3_ZASCE|nr:uncharacterized protein M409DRAFT_65021 [Zasmidium cellare ATCC 36951]KAF2169317.1 hypothetical protein M409DRAFT_65021 [Zasmidium cellare ATCC 36951]
MRLRLRIERNELPAVNVLWTVDPTALKQTISQFLQRVDERVPLEGESWGLEDYAVAVGGYEAFHYSEVGQVFQNEDEVVIKPLQCVDVRARSMTGRDQISSNGMHLLDGVAFGKPLLKRPRRPDVRIPPRKRARLEIEDGDGEDEGEDEQALAIMMTGQGAEEDDEEEDEEDDEDFDMGEDENEDEQEIEEDEEDSDEDRSPVRPRRSRRRQLVDDEAEEVDEDDTDESDDNSSEEESDTSEDTDVSESTDTSSSDSDDASSETSWNGIESSPTKPKTAPIVNGHDGSLPTTTTKLISSDTISFTPPFEGAEHTRMRNARRREQRRMKHLKETGALAPNATMDDMRLWIQQHGASDGNDLKKTSRINKTKAKDPNEQQKMEKARQRLVESIAAGGVDVQENVQLQNGPAPDIDSGHAASGPETLITSNGQATSAAEVAHNDEAIVAAKSALTNSDQRRQDASPGEEVSDEDEAPEEESSVRPTFAFTDMEEKNGEIDSEDASTARRAHVNLTSANRLVFGSLGVRTPRTQADKDALQKKLSARASRNVPSKEVEPANPEAEEDEDPEAWRAKIELSAVECSDDGVELSAPPFPFKQRWDPQYQYGKKRKKSANSRATKSRKLVNGSGAGYVESYDKYNTNGEGDALNYDDPEDDEEDDSYWEEGALLDDEENEMDQPVDDGFPALPADLAGLPDVLETDAREGDFITYKQLVCSAATNWMPTTVNRTARLQNKSDDGAWNVTFSIRDKRPKEYDGEGNRIYSKFEMEGLSDDEDEELEDVLVWTSMQEPKLLKRAASE